MSLLKKILPPASRDAFARLVLRRIVKQNPELAAKAKYNPSSFAIATGKDDTTIYLSNAYAEYLDAPVFQRNRVIAFYATLNTQAQQAIPSDFEAAKGSLLPRVRERAYLAFMPLQFKLKNIKVPQAAHRLLSEHLTVEIVHDTPQSMSSIPPSQLTDWGISFEDALQVARDNLWKISNDKWLQPQPGLHVAPWEDFHSASRLFLHDLIWQLPVKGNHVAMIPNRNILLVTGDQDTAGLLKMAELVNTAMQEPRFMTGTAFRLNNSAWEHFLPPENSPAHKPLRILHLQSLAQMYAEQKELLEEIFKKETLEAHLGGAESPDHAFIGTFSVADNGESLSTFAAWTQGIEILLPQTDRIAFVAEVKGEQKSLGFADGPTVRKQLADLLEPTDYYPPRFRTKGFPTSGQLKSLNLSQ